MWQPAGLQTRPCPLGQPGIAACYDRRTDRHVPQISTQATLCYSACWTACGRPAHSLAHPPCVVSCLPAGRLRISPADLLLVLHDELEDDPEQQAPLRKAGAPPLLARRLSARHKLPYLLGPKKRPEAPAARHVGAGSGALTAPQMHFQRVPTCGHKTGRATTRGKPGAWCT